MPIPDFQTLMLPLLEFNGDQQEHSLRQAIDTLAEQFNLTDEERRELLPSGQQEIFYNRVGWARTFLKKAGLLESARRGYFNITDIGLEVLKQKPSKIDVKFLEKFEEFRKFRTLKSNKTTIQEVVEDQENTPEEELEIVYQNLKIDLANDLIQQIKESPPRLFEKLVVELLVKMGYGGSRKDAGEAIGKTGDEGIDGIIKEDRLGLDIIYIQAKRWETNIGRPEVQKFAGALEGKRAKKGIFITTSNFSREAYDFVSSIVSKIVLINGDQLAQLMIDNNIGVSPLVNYEIKKIDIDYFTEE